MTALSLVTTIVESLGVAGEETGDWPAVSQALQQLGSKAGWGSDVLTALQESSNLVQFFGNVSASIAGGEIGAAAAPVLTLRAA